MLWSWHKREAAYAQRLFCVGVYALRQPSQSIYVEKIAVAYFKLLC